MRDRPPDKTRKAGGHLPRHPADLHDIEKTDPLGKQVEAEPTAAADSQQAETDHDHGEPRFVTILNGDDLLGHIAIARSIRALDALNVEIGKFETEAEARAAVVRHAFSGRAS